MPRLPTACVLIALFGVAACRRAPKTALKADGVADASPLRAAGAIAVADASAKAAAVRRVRDAGTAADAADAGPASARAIEPIRSILPKPGEVLKGSDLSIACAGRKPCRQQAAYDAGRDPQGRELSVVEISLWAQGHSAQIDDAERRAGECEPFEYWLVVRNARGAVRAELVQEDCNDGYGAAGVGEENAEIGPNRFSHVRNGGSSWRWTESFVRQLSPGRFLEQETDGFWTLGLNVERNLWSWEKFSGWSVVYSPPCDPDGTVPEPGRTAPLENPEPIVRAGYAWYQLPVVSADAAFVDHDWRTTQLGGCALLVDGTPGHGFVIHGNHGGPADSAMRIVGVRDGAFFVDVTDDKRVGPSARWLYDDHLEIWVGDAAPMSYTEHCTPRSKNKPRQWGVRIADGKVFAGYANPDPAEIKVELAASGKRTVLKIVPPKGAITFVYSDGDDSQSQHALLATSHLVFADVLSLGRLVPISEADAICRVVKGKLEPELK